MAKPKATSTPKRATGSAARTRRTRSSSATLRAEPLSASELEREATLAETPAIAGYLQEHLGQRLTAYLAGLEDPKTVGQWIRGRNEPTAMARERLRAAFQATRLLVDAYGDRTAQSWLFGTNSYMDGRAPASVLRDARTPGDMEAVVPVARAFAGGGH